MSTLVAWIIYILIGALAGWLAGVIMKGGGSGLIMNCILGIVGSILGGWLLGLLGVHFAGDVGQFITAVIGAAVVIWLASLVTRKK